MSLERCPELGTKAVDLKVKMPALKPVLEDALADGLRELWKKQEFCDVELLCAEQTILAHKAVLASQSEVFKQGLQEAAAGRSQVRLADVDNPEAVRLMLNFMYQTSEEYSPKTVTINKDVLRLAKNFCLPGLTAIATHWLASDVNTGNVVERLTICEEYELGNLRERILGQLASNKKALFEVAHSPQIMAYPKLMQALLQQAAGSPDEDVPKAKKGKAR